MEYLNIKSFDTSNVTTMSHMLDGDIALSQTRDANNDNPVPFDFSNFDTSKVTDTASMFRDCESLTSLDLSNIAHNHLVKFTANANFVKR